MRSHTEISNGALPRGHGSVLETRRQVNVDVSEDADAAAGWPLAPHGKYSTRSKETRAVASRVENFFDRVEERHGTTAQTLSGPMEGRTFNGEVDDPIKPQPQFTFLKPCRQLEQRYANVRSNGVQFHAGINSSFRHSGGTDVREEVATAAASSTEDEKVQVSHESSHAGSRASRRDAHRNSNPLTERRESRRKLEMDKSAQCRVQDTTNRDLMERELRKPALDHHHARVLNPHDDHATRVVTSSHPSPVSVGSSFECEEEEEEEEEPERPQSTAAAAECALARKLSRDGIELNSFVERKSETASGNLVRERVAKGHWQHVASPRRSASERYSTRGRTDVSTRWRISSTRCSIHEKEADIDLVAPAAAKFLMETTSGSPSAKYYYCSASPLAVAVPFKWEDAPGRAKFETPARKPDNTLLQLPPRLAVPTLQRSSGESSFSRVSSVVSHPLAGFFPCMTPNSSSPRPHQHDRASKSKQSSHPLTPNARKVNKSFSQPLTSTGQSVNAKPRRMFSSELKPSHPWIHQLGGSYGGAPPSDPTSILHSCSGHSSSSRTYVSCELDASTPRTVGSSASYESIGEDFDLGKSKSRAQAPTLASYLDATEECPLSSSLLDRQGAPTSSGYLNSQGEPIPINIHINNATDPQSLSTAIVSPERPTRLPYKMPSVEEQKRASRHPRRDNSNPRAESMDLYPSPTYSAALEMLSPAVNLMASRRHKHSARNPPWPNSPKPHRRVQFILSICKTLKRMLFRQQPRRSVIGTRLMYHDESAPTTFQFSKPN